MDALDVSAKIRARNRKVGRVPHFRCSSLSSLELSLMPILLECRGVIRAEMETAPGILPSVKGRREREISIFGTPIPSVCIPSQGFSKSKHLESTNHG